MPTKIRSHLTKAVDNNVRLIATLLNCKPSELVVKRNSNLFVLYYQPENENSFLWLANASNKADFNSQLCSIISALCIKNAILSPFNTVNAWTDNLAMRTFMPSQI